MKSKKPQEETEASSGSSEGKVIKYKCQAAVFFEEECYKKDLWDCYGLYLCTAHRDRFGICLNATWPVDENGEWVKDRDLGPCDHKNESCKRDQEEINI